MSFLAEYDALPADDPRARAALVVRWLRTDWRGLFTELRSTRPVFPNPVFTMVTRATDVLDVLAQPSLYTVAANVPAMDPAVGPFMLARDETALNWHEKGVMRAVLRIDDLPRLHGIAAETTAAELGGAAGTIDLVGRIARLVPLRVVQRGFGFTAPDTAMLRWSFATQHAMFRNLGADPAVLAAGIAAGQQMQAWLWPFLARHWAAPPDDDTPVARLLRLSRHADLAMPPDRVLSNICGLLVGAIETTAQAIAQATEQILLRPEVREAAITAAGDADPGRFDAIVFEALRFNPITGLQLRVAARDALIGAGTHYATPVAAGTPVAACTASAMFDPGLFPAPEHFDATRPASAYLHFGIGHHECLGKHVGLVIIPEAVRQVMRLPGIRLAEGAAGRIDFAGGPFPEHLGLVWDPPAAAAA
ncbi:cytochrome P450 [Sphingomonas sp. 37zxx]|uniref:cytochrome P450 n=1 Tax=Sphingomonas sp. 37zxx TaxID=1550073 RepID=UPI00053BFFA0|nr:cytochrome P450 [Sphingomonas sp. 37zxx]